MADKQTLKEHADWCEAQANEALDRGIDFASVGSGAVSAQADFERAGSLMAAAQLLRDRAG